MYNIKVKNEDSWLEKCCKCVHLNIRKNDGDELYCRVRGGICKFKPKNNDFAKTKKQIEVQEDERIL